MIVNRVTYLIYFFWAPDNNIDCLLTEEMAELQALFKVTMGPDFEEPHAELRAGGS